MAQKVILHDENDVQIMPVASTLSVEELSVTDLADIANGGMIKFSGRYFIKDSKLANAPFDGWYALEVIEGSSEYMGQMRAVSFWDNVEKYTSVNQGKIVGWKKVITDDVNGVLTWQPNMDVLKGQMITFPSLGTAETGLLVNPVFMSLINQNTGSSFPAADSIEGVSGKWKLINPDAYSISFILKTYAVDFNFKRRGNNVSLVTSFSNKQISAGYDFMSSEKLPNLADVWRPEGNFAWIPNATSMMLIWDVGRITLQGNSSVGQGDIWTGSYMAKNGYQWSGGVPTA